LPILIYITMMAAPINTISLGKMLKMSDTADYFDPCFKQNAAITEV